MFKTIGLYFCLIAFLLQTTLFNIVLFGCVSFAKTLEGDYSETIYSITLTQKQYQNLKWLNESEFAFGDYLMDVKGTKKEDNLITISYKVDIKEKNFLEKLAEHLKQKKSFTVIFAFSQFEIPQFSFNLTSSDYTHKMVLVSITETSFPKDSPPPKA